MTAAAQEMMRAKIPALEQEMTAGLLKIPAHLKTLVTPRIRKALEIRRPLKILKILIIPVARVIRKTRKILKIPVIRKDLRLRILPAARKVRGAERLQEEVRQAAPGILAVTAALHPKLLIR
jgi:hypothetical protein